MFKQIFALGAALSLSAAALQAQAPEPYDFKEFKKVACTPIKNQEQTGTCWAFSTASFLESEAIRLGKGEYNLSEMYVVRHIYRRKCENYVRRQGHAQFGEGGLAHDLLNAVRDHGIVPEDVYPGRKDPSQPLNHGKVVEDLKALCDKLVEKGGKGELEANWGRQVDSLLDVHFGVLPQKFMIGAISMTPITFRDYIGINPEDYVSITSFTHHPFLQPFVLEIPDNFDNGLFYNLPLEDMMKTLNYALQQGYSVEWDADVSNMGFSAKNGIAVVPEKDWKSKNKEQIASTFKFWEAEKNVTQAYRQQLFDQQVTMDDHLMHIVGVLDETHSGLYYAVKNSWGEISSLKGFVNVSEAYMRLNTISFTVHKNAIPEDVRKKLRLSPGDYNIENNGKVTPPGRKTGEGAPVMNPDKLKRTVPAEAGPKVIDKDKKSKN